MAKICRTCLQKRKPTYSTNQTIKNFEHGEMKISVLLRFCVPELYLGLSSNPEICYDCKECLKVAYRFKKKCLQTERMIGTFLKNARSTGKSVDLYDVLEFHNSTDKTENCSSTNVLEKSNKTTFNAQNVFTDWETQGEGTLSMNSVNNQATAELEVRQSAPNPKAVLDCKKMKFKFCDEKELFVNQLGEYFDLSGNPVDNNVKNILQASAVLPPMEVNEPSNSLCTITNVFSLSENNEIAPSKDPATSDATVNLVEENEGIVIKDEPLDTAIKEEQVDSNFLQTDEDTLDASEIAIHDDTESVGTLQGIIDNIPELPADQYVDIPEFVQINNFGLKELEELRKQQQIIAAKNVNENLITAVAPNPPTKIVGTKNMNQNLTANVTPITAPDLNLVNQNEAKKGAKKSEKEIFIQNLPQVIFINGKKMVKTTDGYKITEDTIMPPVQKFEIDKRVNKNTTQASSEKPPTSQISRKSSPLRSPSIIKIDPNSFKTLPDIIMVGGKRYALSKDKTSFTPAFEKDNAFISAVKQKPTQKNFKIVAPKESENNRNIPVNMSPVHDNSVPKSEEKVLGYQPAATPKKRQRRRIKIVPVSDKQANEIQNEITISPMPSNFIIPVTTVEPVDTVKKIKYDPSKYDDRDVVVLLTSYTSEGIYINDHDYLINPYKRNKILVEENDQWFCMCNICGSKHYVPNHVSHMLGHGTICKICKLDMGTSYMLNVHVRMHTKACKLCTQRVPYGEIEAHEDVHYREEIKFENEPVKRRHHRKYLNKRRRRSKLKDLKHSEDEDDHIPSEDMTKGNLSDASIETLQDDEEFCPARSPVRKYRKRNWLGDEPGISCRVLRSKVKKTYGGNISKITDGKDTEHLDTSSSTGPP